MDPDSRKLKWVLIAGLLVAAILLWNPFRHLIFSVRLALAMQNLAAGSTGQELSVKETKIRRQAAAQSYEAILYKPAKSLAAKAVVLVPGISELGCYHPSLVSLARHLADNGILVLTPDIQAFRHFQITAEPIRQIIFWFDQLTTLEVSHKVRKIGLAGISYSGTLALMAAAKAEMQDRVAFVVGIGSCYSLIDCIQNWFSGDEAQESRGYYPTRFYGRWVVMLAALQLITLEEDRSILRNILEGLLLQKDVPMSASGLTPEAECWYRLATSFEHQPDRELLRKIEEYLVSNIHKQLDPREALAKVRCPVFLIHGAYDDLIPVGESFELHRRIANSYLLVSPFLTHTHPHNKALSWRQKAESVLQTLVFCFQFSRIMD